MWNIVQCAVQGRGHIKADVPCQDKTYTYNKDGVVIMALADGAGSAKLSHYGAEHITQYICELLAKNFDMYFNNDDGAAVKRELSELIRQQLYKLADELKCEFGDLASTLLTVAVKDGKYILLHIGDGVIGYSKEKELKIASQPDNGEFVNTTVFTTSGNALQSMKIMKGRLGAIDGFVLMSDGTEASLYNKRENTLADVLKKIMQMMIFVRTDKIEEQLTDSFRNVVSQATTDDCSIAIMVNDYNSFPGYLMLPYMKRASLTNVDTGRASAAKRIRRYDELLSFLSEPHTLKEISRRIHLKPKYTLKHLTRLTRLGLIEKQGRRYHTIAIMNR